MKKNKKSIEMQPKVNVNLKILPFGSIGYKIPSLVPIIKEKKNEDLPKYIEPFTTNIEKFDIYYEEVETYSIPKTTAGS